MRTVGLCAGIGGIELGLGGEPVAFAETDPHAQTVLATHWPTADQLGDITTIDNLDPWSPDLITAGLPCQPVSMANGGQSRGRNDERYLFTAFANLIGRGECRPYLFLENVAGFTTRRYAAERGDLVTALTALGYRTTETLITADQVGAPHLRLRWFLVAIPDGRPPPDPPTTTRIYESNKKIHPADLLPTPTAGFDSYNFGKYGLAGVLLPTPTATQTVGGETRTQTLPSAISGDPTREGRPSPHARLRRPPLAAADGIIHAWDDYRPAIERWAAVIGRPPPSQAREPGRKYLHAPLVEWMMGFPAEWLSTGGVHRRHALRLLGNACVPHQARAAWAALITQTHHQLAFAP